jgi:hypothetical protein
MMAWCSTPLGITEVVHCGGWGTGSSEAAQERGTGTWADLGGSGKGDRHLGRPRSQSPFPEPVPVSGASPRFRSQSPLQRRRHAAPERETGASGRKGHTAQRKPELLVWRATYTLAGATPRRVALVAKIPARQRTRPVHPGACDRRLARLDRAGCSLPARDSGGY